MNANRLINMVLRMIMRKGMNAAAKRMGGGKKSGGAATKNLNKAARMSRRVGRF